MGLLNELGQALEQGSKGTKEEVHAAYGQVSKSASGALADGLAQAKKKGPAIMGRAAEFYAAHPTLVKVIGVGALAMLVSRISARRR